MEAGRFEVLVWCTSKAGMAESSLSTGGRADGCGAGQYWSVYRRDEKGRVFETRHEGRSLYLDTGKQRSVIKEMGGIICGGTPAKTQNRIIPVPE